MTDEKFAAFLSFADTDRALVAELRELFSDVDLKTYFAPDNLPKGGTPAWKDAILNSIRNSSCFVPILTRNSISRPWVLYECGAADILRIPNYPGRVAGITKADIAKVPGPDAFVYDLYELGSLTNLVLTVFRTVRGGQITKENEELVKLRVESSPHTRAIMSKARIRWIFIAGSLPKVPGHIDRMTVENRPDLHGQEVLVHITEEITQSLLDAGFSISSCSEVPVVGSVVARQVTRWMCDKGPSEIERYRIGGLYPIDRQTRERDLSPRERKLWTELFMEFRKSYLRNHEWLIVLGGNEGTEEEVEAANDLGSVRVCTVPAIGGTGLKVWEEQATGIRGPFSLEMTKWKTCYRDELVKYLQSESK